MAERRMFAKTIVLSDVFLDMPMSARCLYFTLGMLADDDGFVGNPKSIMRQCGATEDDLKILLAKRYLLGFESGVIVIKHWKMNNYLRNDRHTSTTYLEELKQLTTDEKGAYTESRLPVGRQVVYQVETQDRLGKYSKEKDTTIVVSKEKDETKTAMKRFVKPSVTEIEAYIKDMGYEIDAQYFHDYYEANGWKVGKNPMKDWKATVRTWTKNNRNWRIKSKNLPDFELTKHTEKESTVSDEEWDKVLKEAGVC